MFFDRIKQNTEQLKQIVEAIEPNDMTKQLVLYEIDKQVKTIFENRDNLFAINDALAHLLDIASRYDDGIMNDLKRIHESLKPKDQFRLIDIMPTLSSVIKDVVKENFDRFGDIDNVDTVLNEMIKHKQSIADVFLSIVSVFESDLVNKLPSTHHSVIQFIKAHLYENRDKYNDNQINVLLSVVDHLLRFSPEQAYENFESIVKQFITNDDDIVLYPVLESIRSLLERGIIQKDINAIKSITEKSIKKIDNKIFESQKSLLAFLEPYTTNPTIRAWYTKIQEITQKDISSVGSLLESFLKSFDTITNIDTKWINDAKTRVINTGQYVNDLLKQKSKYEIVKGVVELLEQSNISDSYLMNLLYKVINEQVNQQANKQANQQASQQKDQHINESKYKFALLELYKYLDKYPEIKQNISEAVVSLINNDNHGVQIQDLQQYDTTLFDVIPMPVFKFELTHYDVYMPMNIVDNNSFVVALSPKGSGYFEYLVDINDDDSINKVQGITGQDWITINMMKMLSFNMLKFDFVGMSGRDIVFHVNAFTSIDGITNFATITMNMDTKEIKMTISNESYINDANVRTILSIMKHALVYDDRIKSQLLISKNMEFEQSDVYTVMAQELCFDNGSLVVMNRVVVAGERLTDGCVLSGNNMMMDDAIDEKTLIEHIDFIKDAKQKYQQLYEQITQKAKDESIDQKMIDVLETLKSIIDEYEDTINQIILEQKISKGYVENTNENIGNITNFVAHKGKLYRLLRYVPGTTKIVVTEQFDLVDSMDDTGIDSDAKTIVSDDVKIIDLSDVLFVKDEDLSQFLDKLTESQRAYIIEQNLVDVESFLSNNMGVDNKTDKADKTDKTDKTDKANEDFVIIDGDAYMMVELLTQIEGFDNMVYAKISEYTTASDQDLVTIYNLDGTRMEQVPKKWLIATIEIQPEETA